MDFSEKICHAYFFAKQYIIKRGYSNEIDWQEQISYDCINEQKFLHEITWVILASGMSDKVVRKIFPLIKQIMFDFQSPKLIYQKRKICYSKAIKIINHPGKVNAIIYVAEYLHKNSFEFVKNKIQNDRIEFIQTFPFMGKSTAFHLAKNIGLDVAKPDRHLVRISNVLGFNSPNELCTKISYLLHEKISLIDLVLWRYATLDKDYINTINRYVKKHTITYSV